MVCLFVGLCISEEVWSQRLLVEAGCQIISARLMGCVIPTSLSVCVTECEAFCPHIGVCFLVVDCVSDCVDCRFFFACCDWVYAMPHTSCLLIVFSQRH